MLNVDHVSVHFGGVIALDAVSLTTGSEGIHGLIGPNGAGKTTLFNIISGLTRADLGGVMFDGRDIGRLSTHRISRLGLRRTFQNLQLFDSMTVLENLVVAQYWCGGRGLRGTTLRKIVGAGAAFDRCLVTRAHEQLAYFGIDDYWSEPVEELPFGIQRKVELARALVSQPRLLLLDEPTSGLNSDEKQWIASRLRDVAETMHLAVLLIEHDMGLVMNICREITVLDYGRVIAKGTPDEIQEDPAVISAYLGTMGGTHPVDGGVG